MRRSACIFATRHQAAASRHYLFLLFGKARIRQVDRAVFAILLAMELRDISPSTQFRESR